MWDYMSQWFKNLLEIRSGQNRAMLCFEGVRGLAVFLVFLVHFATLAEPWLADVGLLSTCLDLVRAVGNMGVDLFFMLSGYLIYGSLMDKAQPFIPYLRRRIQRIYPTFSVVFCLYCLLSIVFPGESKLPAGGWEKLRYLCENYLLLPGVFDITAMITVAWSLSYEFMFYLSVPLIIAGCRLRDFSSRLRLTAWFILASLIVAFPKMMGGHVRVAMFIGGILVYEIRPWVRFFPRLNMLGVVALLASVIGTVWLQRFGVNGQYKYALLFVCFVTVFLACFRSGGAVVRLFTWTPLRWLGNMSYSYYLVHGLSLKFIFLVLGYLYPANGEQAAVFWFGLPLMFLATLPASFLLFALVEKPLSLVLPVKRHRSLRHLAMTTAGPFFRTFWRRLGRGAVPMSPASAQE